MKKIILSLAAAALFFSGCDKKDDLTQIDPDAQTTEFVSYDLVSPKGQSLEVIDKDYVDFGHERPYTLVVFWATWCAPCRAEIPHLVNIQNEYEEKVKIVASVVDQDKDNSDLLEFMDEYSMNYFVSNGSDEYAFSRMIARKIGLAEIRTVPTLALFKDGEYVSHWVGPAPEEMITSHIR